MKWVLRDEDLPQVISTVNEKVTSRLTTRYFTGFNGERGGRRRRAPRAGGRGFFEKLL